MERPEEGLAKVADLLGLKPDRAQLAKAVELSSADRMRKLEKLQADKWASTRGTRKDLSFVRSAVAGEWKSNLPHQAVAQIEQAWGHIMRSLGYMGQLTNSPEDKNRTLLAGMELPLNDVRN
jgi:Sulfotransferase domain